MVVKVDLSGADEVQNTRRRIRRCCDSSSYQCTNCIIAPASYLVVGFDCEYLIVLLCSVFFLSFLR